LRAFVEEKVKAAEAFERINEEVVALSTWLRLTASGKM